MKKFNYVVCGGTFDHLHDGHKEFLRFAFSLGENVLLGITTDKYIQKYKNQEKIETFNFRKIVLIKFLKSEALFKNVEIVAIDDAYAPELFSKENKIEAIIVTKQTLKGAKYINKLRKELGLKDLKIIICPLKKNQDNKLICSTRVRNGEIQRNGTCYIDPKFLNNNFIITQKLREELKKPFGNLYKKNDFLTSELDSSSLVSIGDVTTTVLNKIPLKHSISIIDMHVAREKKFTKIKELGFDNNVKLIKVVNPAGHITKSLIKGIKKALNFIKKNQRVVIVVLGEEDLSVIPFVILAPLGFKILYGQPKKGLTMVDVSEKNKLKACQILKSFNMNI